jgi:hypothetical protein
MSYTAYEWLADDKMLPHRMREISDSLRRTSPKKRVEFKSTFKPQFGEWQLEYKIWKPGK